VGWLPPGVDPQAPVGAAPRSHLLVAPPAAPLPAYGLLAEHQRLSVLLPLQRGVSLDGLPQLRGSDRLWPLMPGRSLEADRLAQALLADGIKRVMVVRDRSAESKALSDRFVASFANGNGDVIGPTAAPISLQGDDRTAMAQLVSDVDWYRPPALVVITQPGSDLAKAVRAANWPSTLLLAWSAPVEQPLAVEQIGVNPLSRGPGWTSFAQRFEQRWGYKPGVVVQRCRTK
jgi:ABC-type branched-subunit amino acid transport system substrate-binding protein